MTLYRHAMTGERVRTVTNSYEDNRLGVAALDAASPWTVVDESPPTDTPEPEPAPAEAAPPLEAAEPEPALDEQPAKPARKR